jgi:hypothetical protein
MPKPKPEPKVMRQLNIRLSSEDYLVFEAAGLTEGGLTIGKFVQKVLSGYAKELATRPDIKQAMFARQLRESEKSNTQQ